MMALPVEITKERAQCLRITKWKCWIVFQRSYNCLQLADASELRRLHCSLWFYSEYRKEYQNKRSYYKTKASYHKQIQLNWCFLSLFYILNLISFLTNVSLIEFVYLATRLPLIRNLLQRKSSFPLQLSVS